MVELVAIAAKLDNTSTASKQAAPAVPTAAAPAPAAAGRIGVTLKEYSVAPSPAVGKAGRVTFNVRNSGSIPHEFVVLRTAKRRGACSRAPRPTRQATSARSATSSRARPRP